MTSLIIFGVLAVVGVLLLVSSIVITKQKTVKVVERFGKYHSQRRAGISFKLPIIDQVAHEPSLQIERLGVKIETITHDKVTTHIGVAVQYYVKDSEEAIKNSVYELSDYEAQIRDYVYNEVRSEVPKIELDEVYENKQQIEDAIKNQLSTALEGYGFVIQNALVVSIDPDQEVLDAMNRINKAKRDRIAAEEEGEAAKIMAIKAAEADAESKRLSGKGIADQRDAIIKGFEQSIDSFSKETNIDKSEIMDFVVLTQYFDTLREMAASNDNVIFMPHSPEGYGMAQNMMMSNAADQKAKMN